MAQPWYRCVLDTDVSLISERSRYRCVLGSDASFLRCLPPSPLERLTYRARAYCNCHFIKKIQTLYTVPKAFFDLAFFLEILSNYPLLSFYYVSITKDFPNIQFPYPFKDLPQVSNLGIVPGFYSVGENTSCGNMQDINLSIVQWLRSLLKAGTGVQFPPDSILFSPQHHIMFIQ